MLVCPQCQHTNDLGMTACANCAASLRAASAGWQLDQAEAATDQGHYALARKHLLTADREMVSLGVAEREEALLTARAYWLQGLINYRQGQLVAAQADLLLSRASIMRQGQGMEMLVRLLNLLGNIAAYQNKYREACDYYEASILVGEQARVKGYTATALNNLGSMYDELGEVAAATTTYTKALRQAESSGEPTPLLQAYRSLALLYANHGPFELALDYARQGIAISSQVNKPVSRSHMLADLSSVYLEAGQLDVAEVQLQAAYELIRNSNS